ncbi:MAG: dTDP-4-dehydrorhamnose 3,5-epimerase [Rickettsiaceae bacterium]|nr:dTDP-4-dehydrorhamnose 3,5-epimerase [Rickettsiaceae bacterium]
MKHTKLEIPEVIVIEPLVFEDNRGFFFESFNHKKFEDIVGYKVDFVQDNHSLSHEGVLRGLHYQLPPNSQGKLVRVLRGKIFDVAVDIRKNSPTFARWVSEILSAENKKQLWVPGGFAHGFFTIDGPAEVLYKTTDYYSKPLERAISWSDVDIGIKWPTMSQVGIIVSDKDKELSRPLKEADVFD